MAFAHTWVNKDHKVRSFIYVPYNWIIKLLKISKNRFKTQKPQINGCYANSNTIRKDKIKPFKPLPGVSSVTTNVSLVTLSVPLGMTDDTLGVTDDTLEVTDDTLGVTDDTLRVTDDALRVTDDALGVTDDIIG